MQRCPFLLAAIFFLVTAGASAQQSPTSSEPKSGSGLPQTPLATPQAPAPASNPATAQPPAANPQQSPAAAVQPSPSPANNEKGQSPAQDSKKSDAKKSKDRAETASQAQPAAPQQPKTEILDSSATSGGLSTDGHDPILDPPPVPAGTTTLVGGTIRDIDRIRNRMVINVFGGGRWTVFFDERTHIFRNGAETTPLALKKGERVYLDTMLDESRHDIFARNIRVGVVVPPADADGQIMNVDLNH